MRIFRSLVVPITIKALVLWAMLGGGFISAVRACGPSFPNRYLDQTGAELMSAPLAFWETELRRLLPKEAPEFCAKAEQVFEEKLAAELAEVREAMAAKNFSSEVSDGVVLVYVKVRRALEKRREAETQNKISVLVCNLPEEFALYLVGAEAWGRGAGAEAETQWKKLLALPETERRWRTTWATYMLGVSAATRALDAEAEDDAKEAVRLFQETRALAAAGFADSVGLAAASWGQEAKVFFERGDELTAMRGYMKQLAAGDRTAVQSLRFCAARLVMKLSDEASVRAIAQDSLARVLVTVHFLSRCGAVYDYDYQRPAAEIETWIGALKAAGAASVQGAERLAWLAYEGGEFEQAQRWLEHAESAEPTVLWLRAKLALREGKLADAERELRETLKAGIEPTQNRRRVWAELAQVCLARSRYAESLEACMRGEHWEDAAYLAERVLTIEEVQAWLASHRELERVKGHWYYWGEQIRSLPHLLARRMMRAGKFDEAKEYFPEAVRPIYAEYLAAVREGFSGEGTAEARGRAFWRAAKVMREHGDVLVGTELGPDCFIWRGNYPDWRSISETRANLEPRDLVALTSDERARVAEHAVPQERFHYRYRAAELAWWAAALLPNESEETATVLDEAGRWLKARDPQRANEFYRVLVLRCPKTSLGQAAAQRRWFPGAGAKE